VRQRLIMAAYLTLFSHAHYVRFAKTMRTQRKSLTCKTLWEPVKPYEIPSYMIIDMHSYGHPPKAYARKHVGHSSSMAVRPPLHIVHRDAQNAGLEQDRCVSHSPRSSSSSSSSSSGRAPDHRLRCHEKGVPSDSVS